MATSTRSPSAPRVLGSYTGANRTTLDLILDPAAGVDTLTLTTQSVHARFVPAVIDRATARRLGVRLIRWAHTGDDNMRVGGVNPRAKRQPREENK